MTKIQLRRIVHAPVYNDDHIDLFFVKGTMKDTPTVGESFVFYRDHLDAGWWRTTPVLEVIEVGNDIHFTTQNSTYIVRKGWEETQ